MEAAATTSTATTTTTTTDSTAALTNLDLAFILDCTASMDVYIDHAKENIHLIADEIIQTENCSLRIGLIEYRDHPPQEYTFVTRVHNFTDNIELARKFISQCNTNGGGDVAECICCGLSDCLNKLDWRDDSVKLAILITDGPPHGLIGVFDDYFPKGCPIDAVNNDPVRVAHRMAERAITLYCAGCEPSLTFYRPFFIPLTLITGGQYIPLDEADSLSNIIIGGSHEEILMEKLMDQVNNEVLKESVRKEKPLDEDELTKKIHFILNSNSNDRKHKRSDHHHPYHMTPKQKFNEDMRKMSNLKTLDEFNQYIADNDVRISPTNFFIDVLDPLPMPSISDNHYNQDNSNSQDFSRTSSSSKSKNSILNSKRRKNNSDDSDDQQNQDKRNSSPDNSSPESSGDGNGNDNTSNSSDSNKSNMDASSNSNSNSMHSSLNSHSNSTHSSLNSHSNSIHPSCSSASTGSGTSNSNSSSSASLQSKVSGTSQSSLATGTASCSSMSTTSRVTHMVQHINIDQARRLVKKSLARNKLNKK